MEIDVGNEVTRAVSVRRNNDIRVYFVEYDMDTKVLRKIVYMRDGKRIEIGARVLEEMIEIVKSMGLKFP
jgi:pheromone shutdown protein TraB